MKKLNKINELSAQITMMMHGITMSEVAQKVGISKSTMHWILHGGRAVSDETLKKIADAMGTAPSNLVTAPAVTWDRPTWSDACEALDRLIEMLDVIRSERVGEDDETEGSDAAQRDSR